MGETVVAALKKLATAAATDQKFGKKLLTVVLILIVAILTPIFAVVSVFNSGVEIDWDRLQTVVEENLSDAEIQRLQLVEDTMHAIETEMAEAELDAHCVLEAQVLYTLALSEYANEPDFVEKLVACFAPEQTDAELVAAVNAAFGTNISTEEFTKLMGSISPDIVSAALSQLGNIGGEPYWSWYGFETRGEWCACFVSWCANESGYLEGGILPKFSYCPDGVNWFRSKGQWLERTETPSPGMIIFFDWARNGQDGTADHVGIVERVENGVVYTIEGNSSNSCRERQYAIGYYEILGYGTYDASGTGG